MKEQLLSLRKVNKFYDDVHILKDISLDIRDGEFLTFLGPSGCGKQPYLDVFLDLRY